MDPRIEVFIVRSKRESNLQLDHRWQLPTTEGFVDLFSHCDRKMIVARVCHDLHEANKDENALRNELRKVHAKCHYSDA